MEHQEAALITMTHVNKLPEENGKNILFTTCYTCHNPKVASHDALLAPPLAGIKYKYKKIYPNEVEFITKMTEFIAHPSKEKAVMKGPVKRFGLMPKTALIKEEIEEVVRYIYNNELETPSWFSEHFEEHHGVKWKDR
jgi:hypothetical protein